MDGNFSADHLKQKNPLDDVPLTNGEGMMTNPARYKTYLAHPVAIPQVSHSLPPGSHDFEMRGRHSASPPPAVAPPERFLFPPVTC